MKPNTHIPLHNADRNTFLEVFPSSEKVSANFSYSEVYNSKVNQSSHPISKQVIACAQFLRDYFGLPMTITSSYRTYVPAGGASYSPHMMAVALDLQFTKSLVSQQKRDELFTIIRDDFARKGDIFQGLWERGCRGFGIYDTFIHIDTAHIELYPKMRSKRGTKYQGENFATWNKMQRLRRIPAPVADSSATLPGLPDSGIIDSIPADNAIGKAVLEGIGTVEGMVEEIFNDEDRLQGVSFQGVAKMATIVLVVAVVFAGCFYMALS